MALVLSSCGDECPRFDTVSYSVAICADNSWDAYPEFGGACAPGPRVSAICTPSDYGWRGWDCRMATTQAGICTIDALVQGQPVTLELVLVHKLDGPCEDPSTMPLERCGQASWTTVGPCNAGAP